MNRKLSLILGTSLALLALACSCAYFLYTSPSLGITTEWDKAARHWRVTSAEPWSSLQEGDLIERIGAVEIGWLHLVKCPKNLKDRKEVLSWPEARTQLYDALQAREVPCTVLRGSRELTVVLSPRRTELSFVYGFEYMPLLSGFFAFLVGTIVLYKKGLDEQSLALFLLCLFYFSSAMGYATSISHEMVLKPRFDYLNSALTGTGSILFAFLLMHVSLIIPAKKSLVRRIPPLLLPCSAAICIVIGAGLEIGLLNTLMSLFVTVGLLSVGHSFLTCQKPIERQQMKWIGLGFVLGSTPFLVLSLIPMVLTGEELVSVSLTSHGFCLILVSIAFSIQKYRLMEIDSFLEGTFVYLATLALLGLIDLALLGFLSSRFAHAIELHPTGRFFLSLLITISIYAVVRDRVRLSVRKLLGREPMDEGEILHTFTETASGHPPGSIVKLFEGSIRKVFKPARLQLLANGNGAPPELLLAFRGLTAPVPLWQSPLREKIPQGENFYLALPLTRAEETECVVLLGELPGGRLYSNRELAILSSLLREARLLYENAWLYEENLKQCRLILEEEKKHLEEKEKLVRDLHDGLGGITTNIHLLSEVTAKSASLTQIKTNLSTISELSREGLAEIRTFIHSLDSEALSWPGLISELKAIGSKMIESNGMDFSLESLLSDNPGKPGSLLYLNFLRIYRESLTNIVKHAKANRVRVRVEVGTGKVLLVVEDDGVGFQRGRIEKGRGLSHMDKRARDLGGVLSIESGEGTRVRFEHVQKGERIP